MPDPLERVLTHFRRPAERNGHTPQRLTAAAFRASVELRLANLEREVADLKGRLNGLIFLVIGTVITQVLLRVMG
jgi:hypothetical protein